MRPIVLITGSSGLIGSALADALRQDYRVVGMDLKPDPDRPKYDFIQCNFTDDGSVRKAFSEFRKRLGERIASVVHLAGYYDFSGDPSPMYRELNIQGTHRVLESLHSFVVDQFIFSSTHILLQPSEEGETVNEKTPPDPGSPYPESKLRTERLIQQEHDKIPAVILRVAGVYNEECHAVPIAEQIDRIARKDLGSYVFPGDPESRQAYVHLQDLVDCIRRVIEHRTVLPEYDVFLVAEPDKATYEELQNEIGQLIHGTEWPTMRIPKPVAKAGAWFKEKIEGEESTFIQPWMIDHADDDYPVSIEHAQEELGWSPQNRLRRTLPKIVGKMLQDPQHFREVNGLQKAS